MDNLLIAPTLAEQFLKEYKEKTDNVRSIGAVNIILYQLKQKYNFYTTSPLTKNNEHIGNRMIFADKSFCDFYLEAPTKAFTGIGSPIEGLH